MLVTAALIATVGAMSVTAANAQGQGNGNGNDQGQQGNGNGNDQGQQGNGNGNGGVGNGNGNGNLKHLLAATPELDSMLLFGTGIAGAAGYAALRLKSRRRT